MIVTVYYAKDDTERRAELLQQALGRHGVALPCPIVKDEHGKPRIDAEKAPHFSLTHSGGWWLCAVAEKPLGIDLEQLRELDWQGLRDRWFTRAEREWVTDELRFFHLWCAHEAYAKYDGRGLEKTIHAELLQQGQLTGHPSKVQLAEPDFKSNFRLCIAAQRIKYVNFVRID
jgi:phosphopantetheinyl transferase